MKYNLLTACFLAGAGLATSASAQSTFMQVTGIRAGSVLNVRSGPGVSYADIGDYQPGEIMPILGYDPSGRWAIVQYQGQIGYVARNFLKASVKPDGTSTTTGSFVVTGIKAGDPDGGLVVRAGAGTKFAKLGVLGNHEMVHVIQQSRNGKWAMINYGSDVGWVSTAYLSAAQKPVPEPMPSGDPQTAPDGGSLPADFRVTGVAAGDVLKIRDAPGVHGNSIGGLAPDQGVRVLGMASGNWAKVRFGGGQEGYVNIRYLTRSDADPATNDPGFQTGITCVGTEPFWNLSIDESNNVTFTEMNSGQAPVVPLQQVVSTSGNGGYPYSFIASPYSGMISQGQCSDGMSDTQYSMSIVLNTPQGQGGLGTVYGCCDVD